MVHLPSIIGILLLCYISIAESCTSSMKPDNFLCDGVSDSVEFRILTGTANDEKYFHQISNEKIVFYVKASGDAEIFFHTSPMNSPPLLKIIIGRNKNSESVIEEHKPGKIDHIIPVNTPNTLSEDFYRGYWISFSCGTVQVGKERHEKPFMTYSSPLVNYLYYISFRTPLAQIGEWLIVTGLARDFRVGWCDKSRIVQSTNNAVRVDTIDPRLYICRAKFDGYIVSGYVKRLNGGCKFERFGAHKSMNYQLLLDVATKWEAAHGSPKEIPANAVVGGVTRTHMPLFICRFKFEKKMIIGNTNNDKRCWAVSKGESHNSNEYDILTRIIFSTDDAIIL